MENALTTNSATQISTVDAERSELLNIEDEAVQELVAKLESGALEAVHSFGRALGAHTAQQTDSLLEQVKSKDLGHHRWPTLGDRRRGKDTEHELFVRKSPPACL